MESTCWSSGAAITPRCRGSGAAPCTILRRGCAAASSVCIDSIVVLAPATPRKIRLTRNPEALMTLCWRPLLAGRAVLSAILAIAPSQWMRGQPVPAQQQTAWPTKDSTVTLRDFKFGTGETLPELKLHYLTLGTPHRNSAGRVD